MKVSLKHLLCYFRKIVGLKKDDYWDDNPYVVL
jgi:hypothetical protein